MIVADLILLSSVVEDHHTVRGEARALSYRVDAIDIYTRDLKKNKGTEQIGTQGTGRVGRRNYGTEKRINFLQHKQLYTTIPERVRTRRLTPGTRYA